MSSSTLMKINLSRDVNDNHVQESPRNVTAESDGKSRRVQLVIPEPKRASPVLDLSDSPGASKQQDSPSCSPSRTHRSLTSAVWPMHGFPSFPPYPYFQYPAIAGLPFPVYPDQMYLQPYHLDYLKNLPNWRFVSPAYFPSISPFVQQEKLLEKSTAKVDESGTMANKFANDEMKDNREVRSLVIRRSTEFISNTAHPGDKKKEVDTEQIKYRCETCNKSYSTFSGLSKHKQFHCAEDCNKVFACKYCEKTYVSLGALKMHIRTHTLPCKCKICGKAFSRPWLLQCHVRTHTGEKPFTCCTCLRAFADRSNLRAHLQTHSDVKKYSCRSCSKTFSRMSLLLKHEDSCRNGTFE